MHIVVPAQTVKKERLRRAGRRPAPAGGRASPQTPAQRPGGAPHRNAALFRPGSPPGRPVGVGWFPVGGMFVRIVLGGVDRAGRQRNASGGQGAALHPLGGEPPPRPRRNVPKALRTETLRFFGTDHLRAALSAWGGSALKGCSFGAFLAASTVRNGNGMPPAGRAPTVRDEQAVFCGTASLHGGRFFFLCKKGEEQRSSPLSFGFKKDR